MNCPQTDTNNKEISVHLVYTLRTEEIQVAVGKKTHKETQQNSVNKRGLKCMMTGG